MKVKMEQFPATNPNPLLNVANNGVILYSNEAGEPLLHEWDVKVGEKLPSHIGDIVQRVISLNNPEKMEVKAGNRVYLVVLSPLPKQECVNISGFDITDCKQAEEKARWNEVRLVEAQRLAKVGSWEWDIVKNDIVWSEQMYKILERSPELHPPRYNEHPPYFTLESCALLDSVVMKALEFGEPYELELEHIREDGIHGWIIARGEAVLDNEGNIIRLRGTVQDITKRKRAEEALW
jgi:PAS domain-containing protein